MTLWWEPIRPASWVSSGRTGFDELFRGRRGHRIPVFAQALDMEVDRLPDQLHYFISRFTYSNTAWEIRDMCSPAGVAFFHNH